MHHFKVVKLASYFITIPGMKNELNHMKESFVSPWVGTSKLGQTQTYESKPDDQIQLVNPTTPKISSRTTPFG